jgi:hypothetical protein
MTIVSSWIVDDHGRTHRVGEQPLRKRGPKQDPSLVEFRRERARKHRELGLGTSRRRAR